MLVCGDRIMELELTYSTVDPFKVYGAVAFSIFQSCVSIPRIDVRTFSSPPEETLCPLQVTSHLHRCSSSQACTTSSLGGLTGSGLFLAIQSSDQQSFVTGFLSMQFSHFISIVAWRRCFIPLLGPGGTPAEGGYVASCLSVRH